MLLSMTALYATSARAQSAAEPYFQQHVYYQLDATMVDLPGAPELHGQGSLFYKNNSPDTLHEVYFHLYWNLFKNGSYGETAPNRDHDENDKYGSKGTTIKKFGQLLASGNVDNTSEIEVDNTIMHLKLEVPLAPGAERVFSFEWVGQMPNFGIRSTWGYHDQGARNFATAQWYPQICVYDNHGWHPDQYIGMGEFYTDYGMYDVTLHLPASLTTVISTGWQKNPEILTSDVRQHLDFARSHPDSLVHISDHANFARGTDTSLVTWRFHADSVRDFAWVADEGYIWDAIYKNGTMHHAFYWENSRAFWAKDAARIAEHTVQFNSKHEGQYLYPNLFMCETYEGGMEYPGIVFIGPYAHGEEYHYPQATMIHEIGHEWYPMMMGSNETDYGYMDEGFNTFITTLAFEAWFGRYNNSNAPGLGFQDDERTSNYRWALEMDLSGRAEPPETKADMYLDYSTYATATYGKTGAIFFMLRYAMGDTAFDHFLHTYYDRWHMKHPYPDDLRQVAEEIDRKEGDTSRIKARGDLRWFFDEWFRKTWKLDYKIADFDVKSNEADVTIERVERGVMPIDLVFTFADGTTQQEWIPVDDWLRTVARVRKYHYTFAKHPVHVDINPSGELLETNRLNNSSSWLPKMDVELFPKYRRDIKPIDAYSVRTAPFIFNRTYGWTVLGSFLERTDRLALGLRVHVPQAESVSIGGVLEYNTILDAISPETHIDLATIHTDNRSYAGIKFDQIFSTPTGSTPLHNLQLGYDWSQYDKDGVALNRLELGYAFHTEGGSTSFSFGVDAEAGLGDPRTTYTKLSGAMNVRQELGAEWNAYLRIFGGSSQPANSLDLPVESMYRLASPSLLQSFEDIYASNFGTHEGSKIRNPAVSGPLVRGYMMEGNPFGRVAGSAQFELGNYSLFPFALLREIPYLGPIFNLTGLTLFGDAGLVTDRFCTCNLSELMRYDFGAGLRFNIPYYGIDPNRTEFQLDFPIYVSQPESGLKYAFRMNFFVRQNF
jgi:hypothetical protein